MVNSKISLKKNISIDFCLFGNYTHLLPCIILNISKIHNFGGFSSRVYVDLSVSKRDIALLKIAGAHVFQKKLFVKSFSEGCMLRYGSILNGIGKAAIIRDADSLISDYEFSLIMYWLNSEFSAHTIRNNVYHTMPIMGGLFGIKKELYSEFNGSFKLHHEKYFGPYGGDQIFLAKEIYPLIRKDLLVFSSCYVYPFENSYEIANNTSNASQNLEFIGAYFNRKIRYKNVGKCTLPFFFIARLILKFRYLRHLKIPGWHFTR